MLRVEVLRAGRGMTLDARIADPFEGYVDAGDISPQLAGTRVSAIIDSSHLGSNSGIAVGRVTEDSPAWRSGLREGDVIFQVNRTRVKTLDELREAAESRISQLRLRRGERLLTMVSR